jgi:hypothetical protein
MSTDARQKVQMWSEKKKASAHRQRLNLEKNPVVIRD